MATRTSSSIQFKRGIKSLLEARLTGDNKPLEGEPVYELDTGKLKIGDGLHNYVDLPYISGGGGGVEQVVFSTRYEFPSVGFSNKIYVATDENKSYIFDTTNNHYYPLTVEGKEIDGGNASSF